MPYAESRVKSGTLTFKIGEGTATSWACQTYSVAIEPSHSTDGDAVEFLDGTQRGGDSTRTDTLKLSAVQDFDGATSFQQWSWDNDGAEATFEWLPSPDSPTYTGKVTVQALPVGGEVGKRLTLDVEWLCVGTVTRTPKAGGTQSAGGTK